MLRNVCELVRILPRIYRNKIDVFQHDNVGYLFRQIFNDYTRHNGQTRSENSRFSIRIHDNFDEEIFELCFDEFD